MKLNIKKTVEVEAKTLKLCLKVCDQFTGSIEDQDGNKLRVFVKQCGIYARQPVQCLPS